MAVDRLICTVSSKLIASREKRSARGIATMPRNLAADLLRVRYRPKNEQALVVGSRRAPPFSGGSEGDQPGVGAAVWSPPLPGRNITLQAERAPRAPNVPPTSHYVRSGIPTHSHGHQA